MYWDRISRYLVAAIAAIIVLAVVSIEPVTACFDPTDTFSGEVVLNKPGIAYDLSILANLPGVVEISNNTYLYRSHVGEAVVIVYLEGFIGDAPVYRGEPTSYHLGVRIELTNISLDTITGSIQEAKENATVWLKNIMGYELKWLREIGVVTGLSDDDIESIVSVLEAGDAGWNSRLIYYSGDNSWHTYYYLVNNKLIDGTLLRSVGCKYSFSPDIVPDKPPKAPARPSGTESTTSQPHGAMESPTPSSDTASKQPASVGEEGYRLDGLAIAIAVVAGLVAAAATLWILRR